MDASVNVRFTPITDTKAEGLRVRFGPIADTERNPPAVARISNLRLQQELAHHCAALQHYMRSRSLGKWQSSMDARVELSGR